MDGLLKCHFCAGGFTDTIKVIENCGYSICKICYSDIQDEARRSNKFSCRGCNQTHFLNGELPNNLLLIEMVKEIDAKHDDKKFPELLKDESLYDKTEKFFKCRICNSAFTNEVKIIPECGYSICGICHESLQETADALTKRKCEACSRMHSMPNEMPNNKTLMDVLKRLLFTRKLSEKGKQLRQSILEINHQFNQLALFDQTEEINIRCEKLVQDVSETYESAIKHLKNEEKLILERIEKYREDLVKSKDKENPKDSTFIRNQKDKIGSFAQKWTEYFERFETNVSDNEMKKELVKAKQYIFEMNGIQRDLQEGVTNGLIFVFQIDKSFFKRSSLVGNLVEIDTGLNAKKVEVANVEEINMVETMRNCVNTTPKLDLFALMFTDRNEKQKFGASHINLLKQIYSRTPDQQEIALNACTLLMHEANLRHDYDFLGAKTSSGEIKSEDVEIAESLSILGSIYSIHGHSSEASKLCKLSLEFVRKMHVQKTMDCRCAAILARIALSHSYLGDFEKAKKMSIECVSFLQNHYKNLPYDYTFAEITSNIALCYSNMGNVAKTEDFCQKSLEALHLFQKEREFEQDQQDRIPILGIIAHSLQKVGFHKKATDLLNQQLELIRRKFHQKNDLPITAKCLNELAYSYNHLGNYAQAAQLANEALQTWRRSYCDNPDHPDIAFCLRNSGSSQRLLGNYSKALELCEESLKMMRGFCAERPQTPSIANYLRDLGLCHSNLGNENEAIKLYKEAIDILKLTQSNLPDKLPVATCLSLLAASYNNLGDETQALIYDEEALEIACRSLSVSSFFENLNSVVCLNSLAASYCNSGRETVAFFLKNLVLDVFRKTYKDTEDNVWIACGLNNVAVSHAKLGKRIQALELFNQALNMYRRIYEGYPNHPDIIRTLHNLAVSYSKFGDESSANLLNKEAVEMCQIIFKDNPSHPMLLVVKEFKKTLINKKNLL